MARQTTTRRRQQSSRRTTVEDSRPKTTRPAADARRQPQAAVSSAEARIGASWTRRRIAWTSAIGFIIRR